MKSKSFIDIHNHIIYGFDDGPSTMDVVKKMLDMAIKQETAVIYATSHFQEFANDSLLNDYYAKLKEAQQYIKDQGLPLQLLPGAEVFYHTAIEESAFSYRNYRLNETSRYILFEFPMFHTINNYLDAIFKMRLKKLRPVVAHPERYQMVLKDYSSVVKMVNVGALMQVNCGSLLGHFGSTVQEISKKMLQDRLVHLIASDAHREEGRTFKMLETYELCRTFMDEKYLEEIFVLNQQKILHDEDIEPLVPDLQQDEKSFKRKIFKIFNFK